MGIEENFPPIPIPTENDWLAFHYENGQTVQQFEKGRKTVPRPRLAYICFD